MDAFYVNAMRVILSTLVGAIFSGICIAFEWDLNNYLTEGESMFLAKPKWGALVAYIGFWFGIFMGGITGFLVSLLYKDTATNVIIGSGIHFAFIITLLIVAGGGHPAPFYTLISVLCHGVVGALNGLLLAALFTKSQNLLR